MGNCSSFNALNCSNSCANISSNVFTNFPDDLLQELLLVLSPMEVMEFSRVNKDLTNRLKNSKSWLYFLHFSMKNDDRRFLSSPRAMRRGEGSPRAFNLNFYYYQHELGPSFKPFPFTKFNIVQCSTVHLPLLVQNKVDFIEDLQFTFDKPVKYELKKDLEPLSEALEASTLAVHKMSFWRTERFVLPVFHGVVFLTINDSQHQTSEEMNVHENSSLRYLKLFSCNVRDVINFSHIYDLQLHNCHTITDITCLNDNHKITIKNCDGIRDYSNSFDYCYEITIYCRGIHLNDRPVNVYNLRNVKKLLLSNHPFLVDERPLPSSLLSLSIFSCRILSHLPENNLRSVRISCCVNFLSLANMAKIKSVQLTGLNLESLNGLGMANRSIMISNCRKIKDWSAVRENEFVSFVNNPFRINLYWHRRVTERDSSEVRTTSDSIDMKVITHLSTNLRFPMNFTNAKKLREVIIEVIGAHYWRDAFWTLLEAVIPLPTVEKLVLKQTLKVINEIRSHRRFQRLVLRNGFSVHYSNKSLVLLKKVNNRASNR